jgi:FkbM family methyltransferase
MSLHWQEPEVQLLTSLLPCLEHDSVIDVGAEGGAFADAFLRAGCSAVHVIEPEPGNVESLRARFQGEPRAAVHEYAITDQDATLELHKSISPSGTPVSYGHTVLVRPDTDEIAWNETITVQGRSLASLASAGELPGRVGILKIDTEGHDLAVVAGMGDLDPDVLMVEHWTELPNSLGPCPWTADDMIRKLGPRGFSHVVLVLHHGEFAVLKWDEWDVPYGKFGNLVFLHDRVVADACPVVVNCAAASAEAAIEQLEKRLSEVEVDRQLRLEDIQRLHAALTATPSPSA